MDQYPIEPPGTVDDQLKALGITLQPCPSWCTRNHFGAEPTPLYVDDGFFHYGPTTTISDNAAGLSDDGQDADLQLELTSWVPTLAAAPGPTHVCLSDGGDSVYYFTPDRARQLAAELTRLADQAEDRSQA
ncbi:hypothetical protein OG417_45260 [Actinoallomurus sp. NBC_01490]|uniref:DUF6907 domain-containing protein n=1 Tax=Actinoallomurus sp. NBC_01490 TaxID=2903557 RepID=UPI002E3661F2|nr:hypothetical protein [Actinoallomurus sp. NBC_01490]